MEPTVETSKNHGAWVKPVAYSCVGVTAIGAAVYMAKRAGGPELLREFAPVVAAIGTFLR